MKLLIWTFSLQSKNYMTKEMISIRYEKLFYTVCFDGAYTFNIPSSNINGIAIFSSFHVLYSFHCHICRSASISRKMLFHKSSMHLPDKSSLSLMTSEIETTNDAFFSHNKTKELYIKAAQCNICMFSSEENIFFFSQFITVQFAGSYFDVVTEFGLVSPYLIAGVYTSKKSLACSCFFVTASCNCFIFFQP